MWSYVNNALDEQYSKPLPKIYRLHESCLPIEEFELRELLAKWLFSAFVPVNSFNWLDRLVNESEYQSHLVALREADQELLDLVSDPLYMAALKRVLSVMPDSVAHKQHLIEKIIINPIY
ncbi:hypothetical protein F0267_00650 [Vibrio coralliilyticus]|uniref:Uncharacterized protein n=1 Tax=Vibrio coralliilyticus TaxID=190893 RepID=A0AAN0SKI6_9VIBR|nr:hypothetical protein [Vibrio coralliilyticus]AIW22633.1 hypothetical protein IX92_26595 [Vibrio coralliilyticus]NOH36729.1 hypothetical protein [Vibrio coralliilyticus]PAW02249.1 hypothetical protein CKJ79_16440 [Vibrio coralliilyticus]